MSDSPFTADQIDALMRWVGHSRVSAPTTEQQFRQQAWQQMQSSFAGRLPAEGPQSTAPGQQGQSQGQFGVTTLSGDASRVLVVPQQTVTTVGRIAGRTPQTRVMSPSPADMCVSCHHDLSGPTAICASCHAVVHAACVVTYMHEFLCTRCASQLETHREAQRMREQALQAAHGLGASGARSSELLGTALGAVGGATLGAAQWMAAGVSAGARTAFSGARRHAPSSADLTVRLPAPLMRPLPPATTRGRSRRR